MNSYVMLLHTSSWSGARTIPPWREGSSSAHLFTWRDPCETWRLGSTPAGPEAIPLGETIATDVLVVGAGIAGRGCRG